MGSGPILRERLGRGQGEYATPIMSKRSPRLLKEPGLPRGGMSHGVVVLASAMRRIPVAGGEVGGD
jgi:hypothetical protein